MADYQSFITAYPEFDGANQPLIEAKLDEASRSIDVALFGDRADDAIYLLTAQKLAKSPGGNTSKLANKDGETVYDDEIDILFAQVTGGLRVT